MENNHILKHASVEQGSEAWHLLRIGRFSASEGSRLVADCSRPMTPEELTKWKRDNPSSRATTIVDPRMLADGAISYVIEVASERLTKKPAKEFYENDAMRWGKLYEPEAKKLFSMVYEIEGMDVGFVEFGDGAGASPDWIVMDRFGCEIKCPQTRDAHLKHFLFNNAQDLKDKCKDYYWQCVMGMLATGYTMWKFISYHPDYPPSHQLKVINVPRIDEDIALLEVKLEAAEERVAHILSIK